VDRAPQEQIDALARFLSGQRVVVLTGAGCSTESGIPDYRGAGRPPSRRPIQHDAFLRRPEVRQRYWARATVAWPRFSAAGPNAAHHALAALERQGTVAGIITQNVDRLHHRAGSQRVVELHGALAVVRCLTCASTEDRTALQARLLALNPDWSPGGVRAGADIAPDGDAEVEGDEVVSFRVPTCLACGGTLMPDVVFFGGTVPAEKVDEAWALIESAPALLVVGSSLAVYSGFRFVRGAAERGVKVAILNLGPTRADELSHLRLEARAGLVLPHMVDRLSSS